MNKYGLKMEGIKKIVSSSKRLPAGAYSNHYFQINYCKTDGCAWYDEHIGDGRTIYNNPDYITVGYIKHPATMQEIADMIARAVMPVTMAWKVYGADGRRQRESFSPSYKYDFSCSGCVRIIEVFNFDKTGTNDYSIIQITRNTAEECQAELTGQLYDGIFENSRTGCVEQTKTL